MIQIQFQFQFCLSTRKKWIQLLFAKLRPQCSQRQYVGIRPTSIQRGWGKSTKIMNFQRHPRLCTYARSQEKARILNIRPLACLLWHHGANKATKFDNRPTPIVAVCLLWCRQFSRNVLLPFVFALQTEEVWTGSLSMLYRRFLKWSPMIWLMQRFSLSSGLAKMTT